MARPMNSGGVRVPDAAVEAIERRMAEGRFSTPTLEAIAVATLGVHRSLSYSITQRLLMNARRSGRVRSVGKNKAGYTVYERARDE